MDNIIINSVQPASAVPSVWHWVVSWPGVSLMKIAFQWPCLSCCISFHPFMLFLPYGGDELDQNFSPTFLFPSRLRKSIFCVPGQQKYPKLQLDMAARALRLAQTMRCY